MLGNTIVVLSSAQAAVDLLEKRSSIYSDRLCPPMILEPTLCVFLTRFAFSYNYLYL